MRCQNNRTIVANPRKRARRKNLVTSRWRATFRSPVRQHGSGHMTILRSILAVSLAVILAGCERHSNARASKDWAAPSHPIRVVAYNVRWNQAGMERIVGAIRDVHPDVVLLAEVPPADLKRMAELLGEAEKRPFHVYGTPLNPGKWSLPST